MLLCLREVVGPTPWVDTMLIQHGDYLVAHFSGYSNHGLDESIACWAWDASSAAPTSRRSHGSGWTP